MKRVIGIVAISLAMVLAGCSKSDSTGTSASGDSGGKKKIVIGIVAKSQSNAVFQAAHKGAQDAAKELGDKFNATIEVDIRTPTDEDATKQAEAIEALTRAGVDGIAVSCSEAATVTPAINKAIDKGIAVMCFDSDAPDSKRFAYYGTDDISCGQRVMDELARAMNDTGTIAILAGNQSAPNLQKRVQGVRDEMKKHPNIHELNGDGKGAFFHQETPEKAAEAVQNCAERQPEHPRLGIRRRMAFVYHRCAEMGRQEQSNASPWMRCPRNWVIVKDGHVEVLLAQDCYGWGHKSVEILLDKIVNKKDPPELRVIDPLTRVTKDGADEYGKNWDKWLGK